MSQGFLGGTFDPPHFGHLILAQEALERFSLESISFIPSRNPPHKPSDTLTDPYHRIEMLRLATAGNERFRISDIDSRDLPGYTVDLLGRIASPGFRPCFITGMDSLAEMHTWKDPHEILKLARVLVGTRPGYDPGGVDPLILQGVELFSFPGVLISSRDIRERVSVGRSISYLVPVEVESYIRSRGLYGAEKSH